ncbi:hypothetical protein [Pontibacter sp. HJ8]
MKAILHSGFSFCLAALLAACSPDKPEQTHQTRSAAANATTPLRELCFLQVTQGVPVISGMDTIPGISDSLLINLTIKGTAVTGILHWLPAEKDKMTGTLQGSLQDSIITAIYTYQAEGVTAKEERIFKLEPDTLRMKAGELEEKDGVWRLKHPEKAPYSTAVPKVLCP